MKFYFHLVNYVSVGYLSENQNFQEKLSYDFFYDPLNLKIDIFLSNEHSFIHMLFRYIKLRIHASFQSSSTLLQEDKGVSGKQMNCITLDSIAVQMYAVIQL